MSAFGREADMTIALRKPARLGGLSPIVWERDDMKVILRRATEVDAKHAASLLTELGYPSTEADARERLVHSLRNATSYCLVAELAAEVVGLISAELVFYFPTGSTICRITSIVVSSQHRGHAFLRCECLPLTQSGHWLGHRLQPVARHFSHTNGRNLL